jgi:hypothetical protein
MEMDAEISKFTTLRTWVKTPVHYFLPGRKKTKNNLRIKN